MTFEEWYSLDDADLEDNAPSTYDFDSHHKYWLKAAFDAGRKQALEEAAQLCFDNSEETGTKNGRSLAPFPHECEGMHSGMTYAKAIRNMK